MSLTSKAQNFATGLGIGAACFSAGAIAYKTSKYLIETVCGENTSKTHKVAIDRISLVIGFASGAASFLYIASYMESMGDLKRISNYLKAGKEGLAESRIALEDVRTKLQLILSNSDASPESLEEVSSAFGLLLERQADAEAAFNLLEAELNSPKRPEIPLFEMLYEMCSSSLTLLTEAFAEFTKLIKSL